MLQKPLSLSDRVRKISVPDSDVFQRPPRFAYLVVPKSDDLGNQCVAYSERIRARSMCYLAVRLSSASAALTTTARYAFQVSGTSTGRSRELLDAAKIEDLRAHESCRRTIVLQLGCVPKRTDVQARTSLDSGKSKMLRRLPVQHVVQDEAHPDSCQSPTHLGREKCNARHGG